MANSNVPMFIQKVQGWPAQFTNANGTTAVTIITAGTNGSRLLSLIASTTDTVTGNLQFSILRSGTTYLLSTVNVPLSAGNINSAPSVNILGNLQLPGIALDSNGNPYVDLFAGDILQAALLAAPSSGKVFNVYGYGGDF